MSVSGSSITDGRPFAAPNDPRPSTPRAAPLVTDHAPPRRRGRWLVGSLVGLALLVLLRSLATSILAWWITARTSEALGASTELEDVELRLLEGEITVRGLHATPLPEVSASASSLDIDALTLRWSWSALLHGVAIFDARVAGVDLTLELDRPWPTARAPVRSQSSSLRSLSLEDGRIAVIEAAGAPPLVTVSELHGRLTATPGTPTETRTTHFSMAAQTPGGGSLTVDGSLAPLDPSTSWTLHFTLDRFDLRPLNPLLEQVLEMDVEHGWLSLEGWLSVGDGRLRGRLRPRFEALQLLGRGERRVRHPMAEALFGSMLSGADLPIDIDRALVSREESTLDALAHVDALELLRGIIQGGFVRRLDTLEGYESAVGRVEVDFPSGRLSFFDVTLTRIGGAVGRPFVSIARMDIVVEPSAVDRDVVTYKSIALHQPWLTFVTGATPEESQNTFDLEWQAKVNVLPYPTDRVEIFDGRVEYRDDTTDPPTSLVISDLDLLADNVGRAKAQGGRRGATLAGTARVMDLSALELEIQFTPGVVDLDAAIRLRLAALPLPELNQLLEGRLGIDVSSGTLALATDLEVHEGWLRGTVVPKLRDVRVLGFDELEVQRPIRELLLERRLSELDGTRLTLDHHVRRSVLRDLPAALLAAIRHARQ